MIILGAGMSGMLAAHMLRRFNPVVHEAADSLPNNHAALLRFRTDAMSKATGIPFKKVFVQKSVLERAKRHSGTGIMPLEDLTRTPDVKLQNLYSLKVSGKVTSRSILNMEAGERYIAPPDLIQQLSKDINIHYSSPFSKGSEIQFKYNPCISTIPMPQLMEIMGWSDIPEFKYSSIFTINADIISPEIDVYQTIYIPFLELDAYRVSITGNKLIIEIISENDHKIIGQDLEYFCQQYLAYFLDASRCKLDNFTTKWQKYGKLVPTGHMNRKAFILAMTDHYNIYSLGRFATWRQILMDDVVNDIDVIKGMIEERSAYDRRLYLDPPQP